MEQLSLMITFAMKSFDNLCARNRLVHSRSNIRPLVPPLTPHRTQPLEEEVIVPDNQWENQQGEEGQLPIPIQHEDEHEDESYRIRYDPNRCFGGEVPQRSDILSDPRDDLSRPLRFIELHRQRL